MPQGKVIAVKPSYSGSGTALRSLSFSAPSGSGSSSSGEEQEETNQVFVGVFRGKSKKRNSSRVKEVVWFEDKKGLFHVGDLVEFNFDRQNTKAISAAKNVKKLPGHIFSFPKYVVSNVVLLASIFLLFALTKDSRK